MNDWFTINEIDKDTYVISEYRHWEETHCYLLNGTKRSLLSKNINRNHNSIYLRPFVRFYMTDQKKEICTAT